VTDAAHRAERDGLKEQVQDLAAQLIRRSSELMQSRLFAGMSAGQSGDGRRR